MRKVMTVTLMIVFAAYSVMPVFAMGSKPKSSSCDVSSGEAVAAEGETSEVTNDIRKQVESTVENLFDAYDYEDTSVFRNLISAEYKGANGFVNEDLLTSLDMDYRTLDDIDLNMVSITQLVSVPGMQGWYAATVDWNRSASFERGQLGKWLDTGTAEMVFEDVSVKDSSAEGLRLIRMRGNYPFGLTNFEDKLVVSDGRVGGDTVVGSLVFVSGTLGNSGTTMTGTNTVTAGANAFDFSSGTIVTPATGGDITLAGGAIVPNGTATIAAMPSTPINLMTVLPDKGYSNTPIPAAGGASIAVRTNDGNYGAIYITAAPGATVTFNWVYQTEDNVRSL